MTRRMKLKTMLAGAMVSAFLSMSTLAASANVFTFVTPAGSTVDGFPVSAEVTIFTSANTLTVDLSNLESNPTNIVQAISDLSITLNASTSGATLTSSSGQELTVLSNGNFTPGSPVATGWSLSITDATTLQLTDLALNHLVLGSPGGTTYSNADTSI